MCSLHTNNRTECKGEHLLRHGVIKYSLIRKCALSSTWALCFTKDVKWGVRPPKLTRCVPPIVLLGVPRIVC